MSQSVLICPKCSGEMELGYALDISHGATFAGQWARGTPKRWWLDFFHQFMIKTPISIDRISVGTFRCKSCGFLESYARDEFRPK